MSDTERPLWERMREAADTIIEARTEFHNRPENLNSLWMAQAWTARDLNSFADLWEIAASQDAERRALEDQLTRWIFNSSFSEAEYESNPLTVDRCRNSAKALLERFDISPKEAS
ncbi:hypothetical protein [Mycolicibacterium neoaurum]|uniref:hypothetical protein n=1 Tax=Mycolicibacterium neoaurum TaxID=1795 RepID=UPI00114D499C|nr:hypothetical protein [Mycolicibacterium neoaurum]